VNWRPSAGTCDRHRGLLFLGTSSRLRSKYYDTWHSGSYTWFSESRALSYEGPLSKHGEDPPRQSLIYFPFHGVTIISKRVLQKQDGSVNDSSLLVFWRWDNAVKSGRVGKCNVPVHAMNTFRRSGGGGGIVPFTLNFGTRWRWVWLILIHVPFERLRTMLGWIFQQNGSVWTELLWLGTWTRGGLLRTSFRLYKTRGTYWLTNFWFLRYCCMRLFFQGLRYLLLTSQLPLSVEMWFSMQRTMLSQLCGWDPRTLVPRPRLSVSLTLWLRHCQLHSQSPDGRRYLLSSHCLHTPTLDIIGCDSRTWMVFSEPQDVWRTCKGT
jgi:hypothetical protein